MTVGIVNYAGFVIVSVCLCLCVCLCVCVCVYARARMGGLRVYYFMYVVF